MERERFMSEMGESNPQENREEELRRIDPVVEDVKGIYGQYTYGRIIRNELFNEHPELKEVYDKDPKEQDNINRLIEQRAAERGRATLDFGRAPVGRAPTRREQLGEAREGFEWKAIESPVGPRMIEVPIKTEDKVTWMRDILYSIEASELADGGEGSKEALNEVALVISHFRRHKEENLEDLATKMYDELIARLTLHTSFLQFRNANDPDSFMGSIASINHRQANFFFRDSKRYGEDIEVSMALPIWDAFIIVNKHAERILRAKDEGSLNAAREAIVDELKLKKPAPEDADSKLLQRIDIDLKSAQRIAERLWEIGGERVRNDILVDKSDKQPVKDYSDKTEIGKQTKEAIENRSKKVEFLGKAPGGNRILREAIKMREALYADAENSRAYFQLVDGVDFKGESFLKQLPGSIEDRYKERLSEKYQDMQLPVKIGKETRFTNEDPRYALALAEDHAKLIAEKLFGVSKEVKTKKTPEGKEVFDIDAETGRQKYKWPDDMPLENIHWDGLDDQGNPILGLERFRPILGELPNIDLYVINQDRPFNFWAFRKVASVSKVKDQLTVKKESYLRHPSDGGLESIVDIFNYQGGDQYDTGGVLIGNYAKFIMSDEARKAGLSKVDIGTADNVIVRFSRKYNLDEKGVSNVVKEVFGESAFVDVRIFLSQVRATSALGAFILALLSGITTKGFDLKSVA